MKVKLVGGAVHHLRKGRRSQAGSVRSGRYGLRTSGEDCEASQEDDRQHRVPPVSVRRQGCEL